MSFEQGFPDYNASTQEAGPALYAIVLVYTSLCFLMVVPLVLCGRRNEEPRHNQWYLARGGDNIELGQQHPERHDPPLQDPEVQQVETGHVETQAETGETMQNETHFREKDTHASSVLQHESPHTKTFVQSIGGVFRELDRLAASAQDDDPEFIQSTTSGSVRGRNRAPLSSTGERSTVPSAATTSRLHSRPQQPRHRIWDVRGGRRRKTRTIGRIGTVQMLHVEPQGQQSHGTAQSLPDRRSAQMTSSRLLGAHNTPRSATNGRGGISRRITRSRGGSSSSDNSGPSMPGTLDDIGPNDAADAGDPGRANSFDQIEVSEVTVCCGPRALWRPQTLAHGFNGLVEIANPDSELKAILGLGFPLTLGSIAESAFHAILVVLVSHYFGTDSMVAFILVSLLIGFTDELLGAIADAESTLCSQSLEVGDMHLTGQFVQLAIFFHLAVAIPILVMWVYCIDDVVLWFVASSTMAEIAQAFARIAVLYHLFRTLSRTITGLFPHLGNENFEALADICEGLTVVITVACVLAFVPGATLVTVGFIQAMVAAAAFLARIVFAVSVVLPRSVMKGVVGSIAVHNTTAAKQLVGLSLPLFIGGFLEYSEWEVISVFVAYLGSAEVATWVLLGVIWKVLESFTEGIGEAAACRVVHHLGTGNAIAARVTSYKALFISVVQSFLVTSILYMIGNNLSTWFTSDRTLQQMLNDLVILLGIWNIVMTCRMICWSLLGAQGRYRLATMIVLLSRWFLTMPIAVVCVFAIRLDLKGELAAGIIGYATALLALAYGLFRSDWVRLSHIMQARDGMEQEDGEREELLLTNQNETNAFPSVEGASVEHRPT